MNCSVESSRFVGEFSAFLDREGIFSSNLTLREITDKFVGLYRSLRVTDALLEADGDMITFSLGNAPQIEHVGFKDVRGLPGGLRWSDSMNYAVSLRRQIYPTVEDDDVPTTDYIVVAYFPSPLDERKHLLSSGWTCHPARSESVNEFLDSPQISNFADSIPETVIAYAT